MKSPFRKVRPASLPAGERLYAIGDIHGRLDLFESILKRIRKDSAKRSNAAVTVLLLGDLVDRGPDSNGVIERACSWDEDWATMECLLGNHEASMLAVLQGKTQWLNSWLKYGGKQTLTSYGLNEKLLEKGEKSDIAEAARAAVPKKHRKWLKKRPTSLARGDYIFAHAGIQPGVPHQEQKDKDLLWIREKFLKSKEDHGAIVVHGHTITTKPEIRPNRIGIDTGAYFSEKLTALGLEAGERWFLKT